MEYTDEERQIAQAIVGNADYCALLAKVFLATEDKLTMEVVSKKNDKELGEFVRADMLADNKVRLRWEKLKQLGQRAQDGSNKVPR